MNDHRSALISPVLFVHWRKINVLAEINLGHTLPFVSLEFPCLSMAKRLKVIHQNHVRQLKHRGRTDCSKKNFLQRVGHSSYHWWRVSG